MLPLGVGILKPDCYLHGLISKKASTFTMNNLSDYTLLQHQGDQLSFATLMENDSKKSIHGSLSSVRNIFEKGGVTGITLENAINYTEDLIMPMLHTLPKHENLIIDGTEFEAVVRHLTSSTNEDLVSLDSVESLYRQLADYSQGSKTAWRESISAEQGALALVVIRETMHHGGFQYVSLLSRALTAT